MADLKVRIFVLNARFDRKPVSSTKNREYVVRPGRTTNEACRIGLKFTNQNFDAPSEN